jgi:hypothetical protein
MWKKYGRTRQTTDDNIIRRTRFAYWVTKATDCRIIQHGGSHAARGLQVGDPSYRAWVADSVVKLRPINPTNHINPIKPNQINKSINQTNQINQNK